MILYELAWTEACRYRAVIEEANNPSDAQPSNLTSLHNRLHAKTRGHG